MSRKEVNKINLILDRIKKAYNLRTDVELARFLGVKPCTISVWAARESINYELIFSKCNDIDRNWLLTGEEKNHLKKPEIRTPLEKSTVGQRFKTWRKKQKLTLKDLSIALGETVWYLSKVERDKKRFGQKTLALLKEKFPININWLLEGLHTLPDNISASRSIPINLAPVLGNISAGTCNDNDQNVDAYLGLPNIPPGCFAYKVRGECMYPTINPGDFIIYDPSDTDPKDDDIIAASNGWGRSMLRRYMTKDGKAYLICDNPDFVAIRYDPEEQKIIGKVIAAWRKLDV